MFCPVCGSEVENDSVCENCNYHFENIFQNAVSFEETSESPVSVTEELSLDKNTQQENGNIELNGDTENKNGVNAIFQDGVKKLKNKPLIIIGVIFLCVLVTGIGFLMHINSDSYKTDKAITAILAGSYKEGVLEISSVNTPEADTLRGFVDVLVAKDNFIEKVKDGNQKSNYDLSAYSELKSEVEKFENECETMYLSRGLDIEYEKISGCIDFVEENYSEDLRYTLVEVQTVNLNMPERYRTKKGGPYFKIETFQSRNSTSSEALVRVENNYNLPLNIVSNNVPEVYIKFKANNFPDSGCGYYPVENSTMRYVDVSSHTMMLCYDLISYSEQEVYNCSSKVEEWLKEFDADAELYITKSDFTYSSYMGGYLDDIDEYTDMENNASEVVKCLKMDVLYYLLVGSAPDA